MFTLQDYLADPDVRVRAWRQRLDHAAWDARPNAGHERHRRARRDRSAAGRRHPEHRRPPPGVRRRARAGDRDPRHAARGRVPRLRCTRADAGDPRPGEAAGEPDPACSSVRRHPEVGHRSRSARRSCRGSSMRPSRPYGTATCWSRPGTSLSVQPAASLADIAPGRAAHCWSCSTPSRRPTTRRPMPCCPSRSARCFPGCWPAGRALVGRAPRRCRGAPGRSCGSNSGSLATWPPTHSPNTSTLTAVPGLDSVGRQVGVRDRLCDGVAVAARRDPADDRAAVAEPHRLAAQRHRPRVVEHQAAQPRAGAVRPLRSRAATSASRPRNPPGLSSSTQKPRPASYGVVSGVTSVLHTR